MLRLTVAILGASVTALVAPVPGAAQVALPRPAPADVATSVGSVGYGAFTDTRFTPGFAERVKVNANRLRASLQALGNPSMARPLGNDQYMVYYPRGFVLWSLNFSSDGRISGATFEIKATPGTKGISLATRDQSGTAAFWNGLGEVAQAYQEQRRQEEEFNNAVLARIYANGGYASEGSGVGARGSIVSDEAYKQAEELVARGAGPGDQRTGDTTIALAAEDAVGSGLGASANTTGDSGGSSIGTDASTGGSTSSSRVTASSSGGTQGAIIVEDRSAEIKARAEAEAVRAAKATADYEAWQAREADRKRKVAAEQSPGPNTGPVYVCPPGPGTCVNPQ